PTSPTSPVGSIDTSRVRSNHRASCSRSMTLTLSPFFASVPARLASYARYYGHANPSANEIWLEWRIVLWVSQLRMKFRSNRLTNDQSAASEAIGVRFTRPYRDPKPRRPTREEYREREYLRQ